METENIIIYSLTCPLSNKVKYIGATRCRIGLKKRLTHHVCDRNSCINRKNNWIKKLFKQGLRPIIEEVDIVSYSEWGFWESYYIDLFKSWNFNLYNINPGGENPPILLGKLNHNFGKKLSQETKNKISKRLKGNIIPISVREKISKGLIGKIKSKKTCEKISKSKKFKNGNPISLLNSNTGEVLFFNTLSEASFKLKISESTIRSSLKRNLMMRNGFSWKYI